MYLISEISLYLTYADLNITSKIQYVSISVLENTLSEEHLQYHHYPEMAPGLRGFQSYQHLHMGPLLVENRPHWDC